MPPSCRPAFLFSFLFGPEPVACSLVMNSKEAEQFAREHLVEGFPERERAGTFHREGWAACAKAGIFSAGLNGSIDDLFALLRGLGRGTPDMGFHLALNAHLWGTVMPLHRHGDNTVLPGCADGSLIGTHAITEPETGSDLAAMTTVAVPEGEGFHLKGVKTYITNATVADLFLVYAKTSSVHRKSPLTVFLVKRDDPGVTVVRPLAKMGCRTAPFAEVSFDCRLRRDRIVGREGSGLTQFHTSLELERAGVFASVLGVMESQLDRTVARAREREAFEKPIGSFQSVSNRVVDMKMRTVIGARLLDAFLEKRRAGRRAPMESAMLKLFLGEAFVESSLDAVRIHGAWGYTEESGVEHQRRDAVGGLLLSGTAEMQRHTIARLLGLRPE